MNFLKKLFGNSNEAEIKKLQKIVDEINANEPAMQKLTDAQLRAKTDEFKNRISNGETLDQLLPEAFAVVREAFVRTLGKRLFDVQLIGGIVLHQGRIAEMKTGEGKTLTAALPAYLNALTGHGVHIVTVNDYLVKFQGEWMGKVYRFLGLTVGFILHEEDDLKTRHQQGYRADITYCTNNELGFDYLRDNMEKSRASIIQRELNYAIVDEVDSILIDEARTPLIISGQGDKSTDLYAKANALVSRFREYDDYEKDEKMHTVTLTEQGTRKAESFFNIENLTDIENQTVHHHTLAALKAYALMKRDDDYVVQDGQVVIVDEFTGRLMVGRRYSDGLHQAIEAKEGVKVERESKTLATITFQNYFRMYKKLSGMTGTAKTEEPEFQSIYGLDVVQIPTNRPMIRKDHNDVIYRTVNGKFAAVVEEIIKRHNTGQPVLVGTVSVEKSETLSHMLKMRGIPHEVLNAKFHQKEAEIVAQAGHYGAVTIATNMAGRGTDILLGGNPEFMARRKMRQDDYDDDMITLAMGHDENVDSEVLEARKIFYDLLSGFEKETNKEHDKVVETGGLHIIGTERHESRRIDNQLRGRAGRQGDPGSSRFYVSLEDDLMRLFGTDRVSSIVGKLGMEEDQELDSSILSKQIENAQKRVEGRNFDTRKHVLQYDDVMNKQREVIYAQRRSVLMEEDARESVLDMIRALVTYAVELYASDKDHPELWDLAGLFAYLEPYCLKKDSLSYTLDEQDRLTRDTLIQDICDKAFNWYKEREAEFESAGINIRNIERHVILTIVDEKWMDHIDNMDQLREGIGLRAYGHKDPVNEYRVEGFAMFEEMIRSIQEGVIAPLFHLNIERADRAEKTIAPQRQVVASHGHTSNEPRKPVKAEEKIGRNSPCPCGSGKKYKNCCGKTAV